MTIFVISGGSGATGELLAHTVAAQFPNHHLPIVIKANVTDKAAIPDLIAQIATGTGNIIIHTMVDGEVRQTVIMLAQRYGVPTFDLAGPLMDYLTLALQTAPLGQPGRYRQLHEDYFRRVEAIEFAVAHDDGKRLDEIHLADAVLLGVSRVGKTPLSMYLGMLGWRVANVPLVPPISLADAIIALDPRRVFGLMITPVQLAGHRRARQRSLGFEVGAYFDHHTIIEELRAAHHLFAQHHFTVIDVTDKPIESTSEEIIALLAARAP